MSGFADTVLDLVSRVDAPEIFLIVAVLAMAETLFMADIVVPGELGMALAGLAAAETSTSLPAVIVAGALGAATGDFLSYLIGRNLARPMLKRFAWLRKHTDTGLARAHYYFSRHGGRAVFLGRFVGFLRALVPVTAGMGNMPIARFAFWNLAASLSWASLVISLGYYFGRPFVNALDSGTSLAATVVAAAMIFALWKWARRVESRRRARVSAAAQPPAVEIEPAL